MILDSLFSHLPLGLKEELLEEFNELINNFSQGQWRASGLNGGRFCEISYCIIEGVANGVYAETTNKPRNFVSSCQQLESNASLPRSFRFVIPRLLIALYEMRNHRNIGHVGGDINPSFMDASFVAASAKWIMAEFVRYFHNSSEKSAQSTVDSISQYASPLVWSDIDLHRVLDTKLGLDQRILLLLSAAGGRASRDDLFRWIDYGSKSTFNRRILSLHEQRLIESKAYGRDVRILPPGIKLAAEIASATNSPAA